MDAGRRPGAMCGAHQGPGVKPARDRKAFGGPVFPISNQLVHLIDWVTKWDGAQTNRARVLHPPKELAQFFGSCLRGACT